MKVKVRPVVASLTVLALVVVFALAIVGLMLYIDVVKAVLSIFGIIAACYMAVMGVWMLVRDHAPWVWERDDDDLDTL